MKALSILQPWAHAIIHLGKDIENRDWRTQVRGTVAIHAGKRIDDGEAKIFAELYARINGDDFSNVPPFKGKFEYGSIIGVADIVDCVSAHPSKWFYGKWGFVLKNPRALKTPIPFKGKLNFWNVPAGVEAQIWEQLNDK